MIHYRAKEVNVSHFKQYTMFKKAKLTFKIIFFVLSVVTLMTVGTGFSFVGLTLVEKNGRDSATLSYLLQDLQKTRVSFLQLVMPVNDHLIRGSDPNEQENFAKLFAAAEQNVSNLRELISLHPEFEKYANTELDGLTLMEHIPESLDQIRAQANEVFSLDDPYNNPLAGTKMESIDSEADHVVRQLNTIIHQVETDQQANITWAKNFRFYINATLAVVLVIAIAICFALMFYVFKNFIRPLQRLLDVIRSIKDGNSSARAVVYSNDEIGQLCATFNEMTNNLQETNRALEHDVALKTAELKAEKDSLEKKVSLRTQELNILKDELEVRIAEKTNELQQRLAELERINTFMTGREIRMIDLKRDNERLRALVGEEPRPNTDDTPEKATQ